MLGKHVRANQGVDLSWVHPQERGPEVVLSVSNIKQLSAVRRDLMSFKMKMSPNLDKLPVFGEQMLKEGLRVEHRSLTGLCSALALCLTSYVISGKSLNFS